MKHEQKIEKLFVNLIQMQSLNIQAAFGTDVHTAKNILKDASDLVVNSIKLESTFPSADKVEQVEQFLYPLETVDVEPGSTEPAPFNAERESLSESLERNVAHWRTLFQNANEALTDSRNISEKQRQEIIDLTQRNKKLRYYAKCMADKYEEKTGIRLLTDSDT